MDKCSIFFLILETYFRKFSICQKLLEHGTFNRFLIFFSKRDTERDIDTVYLVASTTESLNLFENRSKITPNNRSIPINILARYQKLPQIWQQLNFRFQLSNLSRIIRFQSRSRPRKWWSRTFVSGHHLILVTKCTVVTKFILSDKMCLLD